MEALPSPGIDGGLDVHAGPVLTLAASDDFAGHLVFGLDLALGSWLAASDRLRAGVGAWVEAALPVTRDHGSRLRARLRAAPTLDLDGGELELTADAGLDSCYRGAWAWW